MNSTKETIAVFENQALVTWQTKVPVHPGAFFRFPALHCFSQ